MTARLIADEDELQAGVRRLGSEVLAAYAETDELIVVALLKGSVIFAADLVRTLPATLPVRIDFLAISSFAPDSGRVRIVKDLETDISGRDVLLVEDVVDTGLTTAYLVAELGQRGPRSIAVCTLFDKIARRLVPVDLGFVGFEVTEEYLLGYGLDHAERYRNLGRVVAGDLPALHADRDAYLHELYG